MTAYTLTKVAEDDLRRIIRYTRQKWSEEQLKKYITTLEQKIITLASGKGNFKDMSNLYPRLRMARCGHHYVFCLPREKETALIIAIFHEKMDLMVRLNERLENKN